MDSSVHTSSVVTVLCLVVLPVWAARRSSIVVLTYILVPAGSRCDVENALFMGLLLLNASSSPFLLKKKKLQTQCGGAPV